MTPRPKKFRSFEKKIEQGGNRYRFYDALPENYALMLRLRRRIGGEAMPRRSPWSRARDLLFFGVI